MKISLTIGLVLITTLLLLGGCDQEGPADRAGEKVGEAIQKSENTVKDAAEETGDKLVTRLRAKRNNTFEQWDMQARPLHLIDVKPQRQLSARGLLPLEQFLS